MQWYKVNEKSAGKFRLMICYYLYKLLGKNAVKFLVFFVALVTIIKNKDIRKYSFDYFAVLYDYTKNKKYKPGILNSFRHVLSYSYSLVDKMEVFLQKYDYRNIEFVNEEEKATYLNDIRSNGAFIICNHIGNIDVLRSLFLDKNCSINSDVYIYLQKNHCKIFNEFINKLKINIDRIKICPVEDIDISTADMLDENLKAGGIAFMAGDRVSSNADSIYSEATFLNRKIKLPDGVFRYAKLMQTNIYFVSCINKKEKYMVYLKKAQSKKVQELQNEYAEFIEKMTLTAPYQFYNFYDFFS